MNLEKHFWVRWKRPLANDHNYVNQYNTTHRQAAFVSVEKALTPLPVAQILKNRCKLNPPPFG
jgi:hypothetical protein